MTHTHDTELSASGHAEQATGREEAPGAEKTQPAAEREPLGHNAEGGDQERPRRGLRRGPRSLIARRRAAAKTKGEQAAQALPGQPGQPGDAAAGAEVDGEAANPARGPKKGAGAPKGARNGTGRRHERAAGDEKRADTSVAQDDLFAYVTSPDFDADNSATGGVRAPMLRRGRPAPAKRVLEPDDDAPKLHKVLA